MQTFPHGAQLHQRADIPRPDRGSQDIRQTEQRGPTCETATLLRISDYGSQDPRPTTSYRNTFTAYPTTGRKSIAHHRYGYIVSTTQRKKASTRPGEPDESTGAKRRRTHLLRYLTPLLAPGQTVVADEHTPATIVSKQKLTAASMHTTLSPILPHCTVTNDVFYTRTAMYKKSLR